MHETPLHEFHVSRGAKMVDFAGWHMPVYYRGINEEHVHTRNKVSMFDVSHMGRLRITGDDPLAFCDHLCTRDLSNTQVGQSKYSHMCNERGGILDDLIVSRHEDHMVIVCNASNREKIIQWTQSHARGRGITIDDETADTAMIALQGPAALDFVRNRLGLDLSGLKRYWFTTGEAFGMGYTIYRSGYTGEDGIEAIIPAGAISMLLPVFFGDSGTADLECKPAGLGARDTLRLEAAMPLYGHELLETWDSLTAGQGWCVQLDKDFIGAEALRRVRDAGLTRKMVGFELEGKRVARQGYRILQDGKDVGEITSGTMSPTLGKSIAMGFVETASSEPGTAVSIDLGRKENPATIVPLPFYKRPK